MAMSRKDYNAIAANLHAVRPKDTSKVRLNQWEQTVAAVCAGIREGGNHNLDTQRFWNACEHGL